MKALIRKNNNIELIEKAEPKLLHSTDAIVKVTLSSICTSDLHIINGAVPFAQNNIALGHEFVGEVIEVGSDTKNIKIGDRVSANCETFCGKCEFCQKGFINNCINGGWELGCKIDGCQAEYVRVPFADNGLTKIPDNVSYENALFVGDILSSGYWGAKLCEIKESDTIAIIGAGPVGLCAMQSAKIFNAKQVIAIDINDSRLNLAKQLNFADVTINPQKCDIEKEITKYTKYGAACVIEAAGGENTFETAWKIARPNAIIAIVAMYENTQHLPLPLMYGKNLIFKTGGVDAVDCKKLLQLISEKKLNTDYLITDKFKFSEIIKAYELFSDKPDNCLKIALYY